MGGSIAAAVLAAAAACATAGSPPGAPAARGDATAVRFVDVPTPRLRVPHYRTHGTFPQVASRSRRMRRVNAALFAVLREDQRRYARRARRTVRRIPPSLLRMYTGLYRTWPRRSLSSASTVVVSVLVADRELYPGGNDGDAWMSATVPVSTGGRMTLTDLFTSPSAGLHALAPAVRERIRATNSCVRHSSPYFRHAFGPTKHRYRHFALTPRGLAFGFDLGEVADVPCGRVHTTISYSVVQPYLNERGQQLVAGVR